MLIVLWVNQCRWEEGLCCSYVRAYGSPKLRGLPVLSAAQTSLAVKRQMWNQSFQGGAWDSALLTHSQEVLTVLGPRAFLGGEQRWSLLWKTRKRRHKEANWFIRGPTACGGNRAENRNPGVQLGLMSIFQGDVILFSEPRTVALHWPDKRKQSSFYFLVFNFYLFYLHHCICMSWNICICSFSTILRHLGPSLMAS